MYDYAPIDIKCPHCGQLASFLEPFVFASEPPSQPDVRWHRWGSWIVIEKYPNEFVWKPPSGSSQYLRGGGNTGHGGYPVLTNGLVHCSNCFAHKKLELRVPQDLWWQWAILGDVLYAFDREHALQILEYIKSAKRPARPQSSALGKLPTKFLTADVRDRITAKIQKSLSAAT